MKPNIESLHGEMVRFTDELKSNADLVVYCTGYKITFPFFYEDFVSLKENELPLFQFMFHPQYDNLFFLGLVQPLGDHADRRAPVAAGRRGAAGATACCCGARWTTTSPTSAAR